MTMKKLMDKWTERAEDLASHEDALSMCRAMEILRCRNELRKEMGEK